MDLEHIYYEYIWIDGYGELRSKTKILYNCDNDYFLPEWSFDGSSTNQASGHDSDVLLIPKFKCIDPFLNNDKNQAFLVLCETYNKDGTPHETNKRVKCEEIFDRSKEAGFLFGSEIEYFIYDSNTNLPVGWNSRSDEKSGKYYCGVGGDKVFIRNIMIEHMTACVKANLHIRGINIEVSEGSQGEWQLGELNCLQISDEFYISKYIMARVCEKYNCYPVYHPKPIEGINGTGNHINFSTTLSRELTGDPLKLEIINMCEKLKNKHTEHMEVYGNPELNKLRLVGKYETSSFDKFSYGYNDRSSSLRIQKGKSYIEDRRNSSISDLYEVTSMIIKTIYLNE